MKKICIKTVCVILFTVLLICPYGCGANNKVGVSDNSDTQNIIPQDKNDPTMDEDGDNSVKYDTIDVDLSVMSGTIAYSQVYDMLNNPSRYEGKIVKMQGPFIVLYDGWTKLYYPAVIIKDATACCGQGIEFVLYGNSDYPSGYPEIDSVITVVGEFEIYYEGVSRFCHLVNSVIL